MKLQKTTLILVILALGLSSLVYFYEFHNRENLENIQASKNLIFTFKEEDIKKINIDNHGKSVKFETTENEGEKWQMKEPESSKASAAALSYLINLLVEGKSDRSFTITPSQLEEYGLDKPLAKVTITLNNQQEHRLVLGKTDFEDKLIYALVDPNNSNPQKFEVRLVSKDFQYAVDRELNEWKE
jgi:hypothetical protein